MADDQSTLAEVVRTLAPIIATFALLLFVFWLGFSALHEHRMHPNQGAYTAQGESPERIVLERSPDGHYRVPGRINGHEVTFLVDTGASVIAVPDELAQAIGLEQQVPVATKTAGGMVRSWRTHIDRLNVAGIRRYDVPAMITPSLPSGFVLLGMSFLSRVDFQQKGDRLILSSSR